jgi:hypothetical protein
MQSLPVSIICDLDATLFDITERQKWLLQDEKDWDSFFDPHNMRTMDKPNEWCFAIINSMYQEYNVIFITGRTMLPGVKEVTEESIRKHFKGEFQLFMREHDDRRTNPEVKKEIFDAHIKDKTRVLFVLEDSKNVVEMWRAEGLVVLDCASNWF